mgnify:CR=1 FL=1
MPCKITDFQGLIPPLISKKFVQNPKPGVFDLSRRDSNPPTPFYFGHLIDDVSFDVKKGEMLAIVGKNGAGKSTILELAAGLLTPDSGEIFCNSKPSLVQQNCSSALFEEFAADDVAFGPRNAGIHGKELKQIVRSSMDAAGIPFDLFSERHSAQLSGGEKRRLAIAGILALNKDVVFFDEPTAGLDGESRITVMKLLRKLADEGKTVLFTTHRIDEEEFADRQIDLNFGKIVSDTLNISSENELSILHPYESAAILSKLENVSRNLSGSDWQNKSVLEKISPVLRILIFLFIFVIALSFSNIYLCAGAFLISLIYCKCAKFNMKRLVKNLLKILPFLLIFAVFQMMFRKPLPDEPCFTSWKWFLVTPSKIIFCIAAIIKTYAALSCICGFFISMPEYDLIDGIKKLIPNKKFILIMEVIFRFIPLLIDEAVLIIKTQIIRGGLGKVKGKMARIKAVVPLIVPLIIRTVKRSEALAEAIVMRGFYEK